MDDIRPFPIQNDGRDAKESTIPWWLAEIAYVEYVKQFGKTQTLERLAERGGFGREELVTLLAQRKFFSDNRVCLCSIDKIYKYCRAHEMKEYK